MKTPQYVEILVMLYFKTIYIAVYNCEKLSFMSMSTFGHHIRGLAKDLLTRWSIKVLQCDCGLKIVEDTGKKVPKSWAAK